MTTEVKCIQHVQLIAKSTDKIKHQDKPKANTPETAFKILRKDWNDNTINLIEEFKLMALDRQLRLTAISTISKGGTAGTVVDLKILFATALLSKADSIIIAHNHPSGGLIPSKADIALTTKIQKAGKIMDIPLKDHIIVTDHEYCSFQENNFFK